MARGYKTWENSFLSDRWELFGDEGELLASVDQDTDGTYYVANDKGYRLNSRLTLEQAKSEAERLTR